MSRNIYTMSRVPDDPRIEAMGDGGEEETCKTCDGDGFVLPDESGPSTAHTVQCPDCEGKGYTK